MQHHTAKIHYGLYPLAWLYGAGVYLRNYFFDRGWLRSKCFDVPTICVGNLAVGGTGKTPHTEYLIRLLQETGLHVATLSRGYKRHSKGYVLADGKDVRAIGDEPYQMKSKFPDIRVAVDEDRCHGIEQLLRLDSPAVDVILLDDAYQHRYVKAGLSILLTDYHRLLCDDTLLPAGRLREPASGKSRAQIVVVTKCPGDLKPIDCNLIAKRLCLYPYQRLFFSSFRYGALVPLCPAKNTTPPRPLSSLSEDEEVLLLTGIASPEPLIRELEIHTAHIRAITFGDHHDFTPEDLEQVTRQFLCLKEGKRLIITTEKDAARLRDHPALSDVLRAHTFVLPIEVTILQNQQNLFNQNIIDYVRKNSRNRSLSEKQDAHPA